MHVCIATPDILGPIRNGGVGTAFFGLAQALRSAGHKVSIFYTSNHYEDENSLFWRHEFDQRYGIEFIPLADAPPQSVRVHNLDGAEEYIIRSYRVYEYLKMRRDFDIIHFPDYLGLGFYTIMAKATGYAFSGVPIAVTAHGPVAWSRAFSYSTSKSLAPVVSGVLEKFVVENADIVISPSQYFINWFLENGWRIPSRTVHAFNFLPINAPKKNNGVREFSALDLMTNGQVKKELVFFGRIEQRKGVYLFIDAINDILDRRPELLEDVRVTFLGKFNSASISHGTFGLRLKNWPLRWKCIDDLDSDTALDYLKGSGRIAVIPSLMDNSPCTVVECLERGIPFITTASGGIPELIVEKNELPRPSAHELALAVERILVADNRCIFSPAYSQSVAASTLIGLHEELLNPSPELADVHEYCSPSDAKQQFGGSQSHENAGHEAHKVEFVKQALPKLSVCLLHRDRPDYLKQAIEGFQAQTFLPHELIIVDNGSHRDDAIAYLEDIEARTDFPFETQIVRMNYNSFPGPARNAAAKVATGDVLKFHDDDNISKERELEIFARAIVNGFDVVTCGLDFFTTSPTDGYRETKSPLIFLGEAGGLSLLYNMMGDTNFAIRKDVFDSLGGFIDLGFLYHAEDWLLLAKAQAAGFRIGTIPEPIIWYRDETNRYITNWRKQDIDGARFRVAELLSKDLPTRGAQLMNFCTGFYHEARSNNNGGRAAEIGGGRLLIKPSPKKDSAATKPNKPNKVTDSKSQAWVEKISDQQKSVLIANGSVEDRSDRYWLAAVLAQSNPRRGGWFKRKLSLDPQTAPWSELINAVDKLSIPIPDNFDENKYLSMHRDVAEAVARREIQSGYVHYLRHGLAEGRERPTK